MNQNKRLALCLLFALAGILTAVEACQASNFTVTIVYANDNTLVPDSDVITLQAVDLNGKSYLPTPAAPNDITPTSSVYSFTINYGDLPSGNRYAKLQFKRSGTVVTTIAGVAVPMSNPAQTLRVTIPRP